MTLAPIDIVRSCWAELAGTTAQALERPGVHVSIAEHRVAPPGWIGVVALGDSAVVAVRPEDAASIAAVSLPELTLEDVDNRQSVERAFGATTDTLGPAILAFGLSGAAAEAEASCLGPLPATNPSVQHIVLASAADEVAESSIEELSSGLFVALDGAGQPAAACGYQPVLDTLAHLGVLTAPSARGKGFGHQASTAAIVHAHNHSLVPQWRAAVTNAPSVALAARLGLTTVGRQFSFRLKG